jgi:hypothetical protein
VTTSRPSFPDTISAEQGSTAATRAAVSAAVAEAAEHGISQSVAVLDRRTGKTMVSVNGDAEVPAVSIAKLLFAADWLDSAGGGANLSTQDLSDLDAMISTSNDDIADDYYGYHGESALVTRVAQHYGLADTEPSDNPRYWGGIETTADDVASLLEQVLTDPRDGPYLSAAMRDATHDGADGFDQEFGMNAVVGAGSKQGWGCCLGGVVAIHTAGFTSGEIVVVLSTSTPDADDIDVPQVSAFENDPGFVAAVAASTATAKAAVDPSG